jgi:hypothetical protein
MFPLPTSRPADLGHAAAQHIRGLTFVLILHMYIQRAYSGTGYTLDTSHRTVPPRLATVTPFVGAGVSKGRTLIFFNPHGWHACDTRLRGGGVDIALDVQ